MDIYPLFFLAVFASGSLAALSLGPIWGLVTYVYVYFNIPSQQWWGNQLPELRWSLISAGILLISCFLFNNKLSTMPWRDNTLGKYLFALSVLMITVMPFTPNPEQSWLKIYDFFRYLVIFYLVGRVLRNLKDYRLFISAILFCSFYLTILARHYFTGSRLDGVGLPDASDANMLAAVMILVLPLFIASTVTEKGWKRLMPLFAIPFVLNTFVMCGSRGAFIGFVMQVIIAMWVLRKRMGLLKIVILCGVLLVGLMFLMSDQYKDRLFTMKQEIGHNSFSEISSGRYEIWQHGLGMVRDYPFGAGGGAFQSLSPSYLPNNLLEKRAKVRASHNTYLMVLVEQGFFGFIVYIGFIFFQFFTLKKARSGIQNLSNNMFTEHQKIILVHSYALQVSLTGFWIAAIFIDRFYFELIYLFVALCPVLLHFSRGLSARASHY